MEVIVVLVIGFFVFMGGVALVSPLSVAQTHDVGELTAAGRNEIRAVYGGFGLAIAGVLGVAVFDPALRFGVALTVAVALLGMAGGRIASVALELPTRFYPSWFYLLLEGAMAAALLVWAME